MRIHSSNEKAINSSSSRKSRRILPFSSTVGGAADVICIGSGGVGREETDAPDEDPARGSSCVVDTDGFWAESIRQCG